MGFFSVLGNIFKGIVGGLGGLFGGPVGMALGSLLTLGSSIASNHSRERSQKEVMRSLLEERTLANRDQERARDETERKKKQLTDLRRTVGAGKRSLLSAWYDDSSLSGKQTIGA
jgi:hypothetical protein